MLCVDAGEVTPAEVEGEEAALQLPQGQGGVEARAGDQGAAGDRGAGAGQGGGQEGAGGGGQAGGQEQEQEAQLPPQEVHGLEQENSSDYSLRMQLHYTQLLTVKHDSQVY